MICLVALTTIIAFVVSNSNKSKYAVKIHSMVDSVPYISVPKTAQKTSEGNGFIEYKSGKTIIYLDYFSATVLSQPKIYNIRIKDHIAYIKLREPKEMGLDAVDAMTVEIIIEEKVNDIKLIKK